MMQRETLNAQWLETDDIHPARLDAVFYRNEYTENDRAIRHNKHGVRPLGDIAKRIFKGAFYVLQDEYQAEGVPFLRTLEIKPGYITTNECVFLSPETHFRERKTSVKPRDLVIAKTGGSIGYSAVVPDYLSEANICQDLVGIRLKEGGDAHFCHAFITSRYGYVQANRWGQGNAHPHLGLDGIREWSFPSPPIEIQTAIGSKIRKAERLIQLARHTWERAKKDLERSLDISLSSESFSTFTTDEVQSKFYHCHSISPAIASAKVDDEIAAQYFHPRRVHARLVCLRTGRSNTLIEVASRIARDSRSESESGFVGLDAIDSSTGVLNEASIGDGEESGCSRFSPNDILFSRLRPYLNKVAIWPSHAGQGRGSGELLVYRAKAIDPHYLFFVVKSTLGLHQVIDVTAGSTHPRVDAEVVDQMVIPRLNEADEARIGSSVARAHSFWYDAKVLFPEANQDVESLIDGTLDDKHLLNEGEENAAWLDSNPIPTQIASE